MNKLRIWVAALLMAASLGGVSTTVLLPATSFAASCGTNGSFLTLPAWYRGLQNPDCSIMSPTDAGGVDKFVWKIVLNVIDIVLQLVGYLSVGFIIYGGFKYMLSAGDASGMTKAKTTIMNAVIGLVISIVAVAIVNVISGLF